MKKKLQFSKIKKIRFLKNSSTVKCHSKAIKLNMAATREETLTPAPMPMEISSPEMLEDDNNDNDHQHHHQQISPPPGSINNVTSNTTSQHTTRPLLLPTLTKNDLNELGLLPENITVLENIYVSHYHLETTENFNINSFHRCLRIAKSPWSERVYQFLVSSSTTSTTTTNNNNNNNNINFLEWVAFITHICTAKDDGIARMVFSMYDPEHSGYLDTSRIVQLLHDVHAGGASDRDSAPWSPSFVGEKVGQAIASLPIDSSGHIRVHKFCEACRINEFV